MRRIGPPRLPNVRLSVLPLFPTEPRHRTVLPRQRKQRSRKHLDKKSDLSVQNEGESCVCKVRVFPAAKNSVKDPFPPKVSPSNPLVALQSNPIVQRFPLSLSASDAPVQRSLKILPLKKPVVRLRRR